MIAILLTVVGTGPFNYDYARDDAKRQLTSQCEQLHGSLTNIQYGSCWESGDDGGYTNYMSCDVSANCETQEEPAH